MTQFTVRTLQIFFNYIIYIFSVFVRSKFLVA